MLVSSIASRAILLQHTIEKKMLSEDVNAAAQFPFLALTTALCRDNFGPLKPSA